MAYDEELAHRIRALLADRDGVDERVMFGGLAFLLRGHLAVAASRTGGLLCRVGGDNAERLIAAGGAEQMTMGDRSMTGWVLVPADGLRTKRQLATWLGRATSFVDALPSKTVKRKRR